jgi:hypothetical protein
VQTGHDHRLNGVALNKSHQDLVADSRQKQHTPAYRVYQNLDAPTIVSGLYRDLTSYAPGQLAPAQGVPTRTHALEVSLLAPY